MNGAVGDVLFFGGFPLFVWIGSRHQDARLARDRPGYRELMAETSLVPFAAILAGHQRLVARELPLVPIAVGLVLAVVLGRTTRRCSAPDGYCSWAVSE